MIWAMILAAGESKRMGRPKMLLPFGGKSIIETVVDSAAGANVAGTAVVVGGNAEPVRDILGDRPVNIIFNDHYQEGMLSSIQLGLGSLPQEANAALIMLGDQPLISSHTINSLIEAYKEGDNGIVLPTHHGKRGHPILIDLKYKNEIDQLGKNIGLRELIHHHANDILEVEVEDSGILYDVDTEKEYQEIIKRRETP